MTVRAPSVGKVIELLVAIGDPVAAGQEVAVVESMKVEIPVTADHSGTVAEIPVEVGATVKAGEVLMTLRCP